MNSPRGATLFVSALVVGVAVAAFAGGPVAAAVGVGALFVALALVFVARFRPSFPPRTLVQDDEPARAEAFPAIGSLIAVAVVVHLAAALALNPTGIADSLVPDHMLYRRWGELLVFSLDNPGFDLRHELGYNPTSLYYWLNAGAWLLVGDQTSLLMSIVNGLFHIVTAVVAAHIAHHLYGARVARICFLLMAFFPSLVVYSSANMRDALSWMLIALIIRGALMIRERGRLLREGTLLVVALIGMAFIRSYVTVMLLASLTAAQLVTTPRRLPQAGLVLILVVTVGAFLANYVGIPLEMLSLDILEQVEVHRGNLTKGGSATSITGNNLSNPVNALLFMPKGAAFFLLSPFPWQINNLRQALSLPELVVWYPLIVAALVQILKEARRPQKVAVLMFPFLAIVATYALIESNAGTANRHRGQVIMMIMVFAAPVVERLLNRNAGRVDGPLRGNLDAR